MRRGRIDTQTRKEMEAWDQGGGLFVPSLGLTPFPGGLRENPLPADFWVMLLARIYEAFPLTCPRCGAEMRIIALITKPVDVRAILEHIGEPATPPRIAQARGPPEWYEDATEHAIAAEAGSAGDPYVQPAPEYEHDQRVSW